MRTLRESFSSPTTLPGARKMSREIGSALCLEVCLNLCHARKKFHVVKSIHMHIYVKTCWRWSLLQIACGIEICSNCCCFLSVPVDVLGVLLARQTQMSNLYKLAPQWLQIPAELCHPKCQLSLITSCSWIITTGHTRCGTLMANSVFFKVIATALRHHVLSISDRRECGFLSYQEQIASF